jgi:hypothetical protein
MAIGRISGQLLKSNLIRDGVDLAFETDLLYLNVNDKRIGIKTVAPQHDLDVNGTTKTTNLIVDTQADIADFTISGNTISSSSSIINFIPSTGQTVVYNSRLRVNDIEVQGNVISTTASNTNLELRPNGSGIVDIYSNSRINGNLEVTGDITADGNVVIKGNIVIGDELSDTITINAAIKSSLIPETTGTYDLGSPDFYWRTIYADDFVTVNLSLNDLTIGDLVFQDNEITTTSGQDLVLFGNGTGGVQLGNFRVRDNTITNIANNAISQFISSGTGYFKIAGTNGFVPPRGTNADRPDAYAVLGMTRYNTESRALEIWTGTGWGSPAGATGAISEAQANDISAAYAIMLG